MSKIREKVNDLGVVDIWTLLCKNSRIQKYPIMFKGSICYVFACAWYFR
jgi:hypothetical protein